MYRYFLYIILFLNPFTIQLIAQEKHAWNNTNEIYERLNYHRHKRNYDSSIYYVDELIRFEAGQKGEGAFLANTFQKIDTYHSFNKLAEAFRLTLALKDKYCSPPKEEDCSNCNRTFMQLSEFMILMEDYEQGLRYIDQTCDATSLPKTQYQKALLYTLLELNDSALQITSESIQLQNEKGNPYGRIAAYNHHGLIAKKVENYPVAIATFKSAIDVIDTTNNNKHMRPVIMGNLGSCYISIGELDLAYSYLLQDSEGSLALKEIGSFLNAEIALADIEIKRKSYRKAINRLKTLLENYNTIYVQKENILKLLSTASKALGNTNDYYHYTQQRYELSINEYRSKAAKQQIMVKQFSFNSLKQAIKQMNTEKQLMAKEILVLEKEEEKLQLRNWLLISGLSFAVVLILFSFWRYKSIQTKKALIKEAQLVTAKKEQEILELKVKEENRNVQALSLELTTKKDFSTVVARKLQEIENISNADIRNVKQFIQNELDIKSTRAQLQNQMGDLSNDFYNSLKINHALLTELDVKLSAMIVMKMSNKEIAISKNITPESVKITKNRLKKKLNLHGEQDLFEYLNQYL
jgi:DNA-binding CsgD family transcriptional regulator